MAKKSRMSILKRQREVKMQETQALKREKRAQRQSNEPEKDQVATKDDLAGYGFEVDEEESG
jgi:hypothetical protein